jgi:AcrR family transcriptional regulator
MKHMTTAAAEMSVAKSEGEPKQRGNRATRVPEILEISINSFASEGYAAFNQRRVASGSGIRLSTLQHYFRTREDLLRATVETMAERYLEMYRVPARIVWTRFCSSGGLFEGGCLSGFQG